LPYHLVFNLVYGLSAVRRGVARPVWRAYWAALLGLAPVWTARRCLRSAVPFRRVLKVSAWTPWSPFRRELHPSPLEGEAEASLPHLR
jgi:hypothetical protein